MRAKPFIIGGVILAVIVAFFFTLPEADTAVDPTLAGDATPSFAVRNVRVFDGETARAGQTVLVRDGRIAAVGSDVTIPPDLLVVDGADRTLLPGFIDAHTHSYGTALGDALRYGVTTSLDMFSTPTVVRDHAAQRDLMARTTNADLYTATYLATSPMGHGTQFGIEVPTVDDVASVPAWVDARIAEGADYIKIVYEPGIPQVFASLDLPRVRALVEAAHARNKLAVAHISRLRPAKEALEAGVDGLVHTFADRNADDEFIALAKQRSAFVVPTLTVIAGIVGPAESQRFAADPRIAARLSGAQRSTLIGDWPPRISQYNLDHALDSVSKLHAAGIEILAGTDAPNPGTAHGASMHHELELLVRAGLQPREALAAATSLPAKHFRLADRGRIAVGLRADLLLVRGDPTQDITLTRNLERVWKNGYAVALGDTAVLKP
jgi:imidazolonepropionase-like amidohydrolase